MTQKIDKTQPFSVDCGTDEELNKTLQIFEDNGITWLQGNQATSPRMSPYKNILYDFHGLNVASLMFNGNNRATHYTPEEFHTKYGPKFEYPFELVGEVVEYADRFWKSIDNEKSWIANNFSEAQHVRVSHISIKESCCHVLNSIFSKSLGLRNIFDTGRTKYPYAWAEVDPPEPKTVTRPMTADEVTALGPIWLLFPSGCKVLNKEVLILPNGNLSVGGEKISELFYSKSSTSTEWKKFEVTEVVENAK